MEHSGGICNLQERYERHLPRDGPRAAGAVLGQPAAGRALCMQPRAARPAAQLGRNSTFAKCHAQLVLAKVS